MNKKPDSLRANAETRLAHTPPVNTSARSADELLYELHVRQIELEMQNEELRRAQIALEESHVRYMALYEFAPVGYLTLTGEGLIAEINLTGTKLFGVERNQLINRRFSAWVAAKDGDRWYRLFSELMRQENTHQFELTLQRSDKSVVYVQLNSQFVATGNEAPTLRISLTDITERKQTEEALRKSQTDLNHAQAVAHIGSWRIDICNNDLEWSDETFRIFGIPKDTPLTYQSFLDSVHPEDRHLVDAAWKSAVTGKPYTIEYRIIVGEKVKWVRELNELEFDEQGILRGGFGTTEDITDIKISQETLQHERTFLRQVIDAAPSMIFVKDREGRFLLGNEALAQCYGTNPESLIGLTDDNFNPNADEVAHFNQNDFDVISSCLPKLIQDEKVTHADGSVHWYNTVKIPLIDDDKGCNKLLGVATDITERKLAEEALRRVDRRKDEFLAMLAHELRNPLMPIRNAVQLLKLQEATDPKRAWGLDVIDRQVTHMAQLLDDLLDVACIMWGKITLTLERIELTDIVNNALEITRPLFEARGQELVITETTPPQWVEGDRVRLTQVLSNLLNNAAKYTDESGKITLSVMRAGADAVVEIRDTGIGISPDILPQVFDLFTQADHSLAHSQGGLGIGLTLVRQLVEIHGGTVTAASAGIGQGSSFTVRLPAALVEPSATESAPTQSALPAPKLRILVVDDYADAAESMALLLEMEGHEVETADCGIKAIERAQVFHPQVVLLDIGLPDLDGYEVAKRLRVLPETQDTILIALTGYGRAEDREHSQSVGFNHHLLKPINSETLSALLIASKSREDD